MKFESTGAFFYHYLGASYYLHKWLITLGIGADVLSLALLRTKTLVLLFVALGSASLILGVAAWLFKTRKRLHFLNPDIEVRQLIDVYKQVAQSRYVFEKSVTLKALRSGVDSYRSKFKWSGTGPITVSVQPSASATIQASAESDLLRVHLAPPLNKREEREFIVSLDLEDSGGTARPFIPKLIDDFYPKGLTIEISLLNPPRIVTKEIFLSPRSEIPMWRNRKKAPPGKPVITWKIRQPAFGTRYKLTWEP